MERTFRVAGYGVVVDDGRVLLCRRRGDDDWVLPGGSAEPGEPPWEAVVREVREETGLRVAVERLVGVYVAATRTTSSSRSAAAARTAPPRRQTSAPRSAGSSPETSPRR